MLNKKEKGWMYPHVVDPDRINVCVPVPDDPNHKRAFMGALNELARSHNWQWDEVNTSGAALVWAEITDIVAARLGLEFCEDAPGYNCRTYPNTAPFIEYFPQDPRSQPDYVPEGYTLPPWYFSSPASEILLGTQPGDIVNSIERILGTIIPITNPAADVPMCRVNVSGSGLVRVRLRNMALGSRVWVVPDEQLLPPVVYDTNKDVVSIPAETGDVVVIEHEFETQELHTLDLYVVSAVNDEIPFLLHGAAIVNVELCGFQNGTSEEVEMDCCGDVNDIKITLIGQENEKREEDYTDDDPQTVNPSAPGDDFDGDGSPNRNRALCAALRYFMRETILRGLYQKCVGGQVVAVINLVAETLVRGLPGANAGGKKYFDLVGDCFEVAGALMADDVWDTIVCLYYNALKGEEITEANFDSLMQSVFHTNPAVVTVLTELWQMLPGRENYLWFIDLLGDAYEAAEEGAVDELCCPELGCMFDLDLTLQSWGGEALQGGYIPGEGFAANQLISGFYELYASWELAEVCNTGVTQLTIGGEGVAGGNTWYQLTNGGSVVYTGPWLSFEDGLTGPHLLYDGPGAIEFDGVRIRHERAEAQGSDARITSILLEPIP